MGPLEQSEIIRQRNVLYQNKKDINKQTLEYFAFEYDKERLLLFVRWKDNKCSNNGN